jgi:HEAT repeat protein
MSINPETIAQSLQSGDLSDRLSAVNQLRSLPPDVAFEMLKQPINDDNPRVRYAAVSQLSVLGNQDLEQSLAILRDRLYHDSEIDVQAAAADSMGALKLTEAFPDLDARFHQTQDWLLQMSIVSTLGELGDPRSFGLLTEALSSSEPLVQGSAIGSLGELKDVKAIALIQPFITHEDWQLRYRVAQALGNIGGAEAHGLLETLRHDPMSQVADMANVALQQST